MTTPRLGCLVLGCWCLGLAACSRPTPAPADHVQQVVAPHDAGTDGSASAAVPTGARPVDAGARFVDAGARSNHVGAHPVDAGTHARARPDALVVATSCPATAAEAVGWCDLNAATQRCVYPDAACQCVPYCGGMRPQVMPPDHWQCQPRPRPDGCPESVREGQRCTKSGKSCSYGSCCVTTFSCTGGVWHRTRAACPP